jgi:hypothetical protein
MAASSAPLRAAVAQPARSTFSFELVKVVRRTRPTALTECWDCGGALTSGDGQGFACPVCSSRWRSRWIPCRWWERVMMCVLPARYRWECYRVERA